MKAKLLLFVLAFIGIDSTDLLAQSVVITPTATAPNKTIIEKGSAITFSVDQYGFRSCSNIFTYRWEVRNSKNVLISAATYYSQLNTPSFTFPDADVYTVSVAVTQSPGSAYSGCTTAITKTATSTITVQNKIPEPNVFAATSFGTMISAFSIDKSGVVTSGPYDYFDPFPNATTTTITAAMGRDKQGNFYYLPTPTFTGNGGKVEVWVKGNKDKDAPFIAATLDLNGTSTANVGLYRLGIDSKGFGWILAGDNDKIYLARFQAKGKTISPLERVDEDVTLPPGITPANFESGDLAFSKNGTMYVLAGSASGTYIFTMKNQNSSNAELVLNWTLKTATGGNFNTMITGTIFDENGSMYFSALDGMYFVDHTSINTAGQNTVRTKKIWTGSYLTDLATDQFPEEALPPPVIILPVTLESFNGIINNHTAKLAWQTSMEENIQGFTIQRSYNGRDFKDVALVFSGGAGSDYKYTDVLSSSASGTLYYRLKIHEANGYTYSKTIKLQALEKNNQTVTLGPNPFHTSLQITIIQDKEAEMPYFLSEASGRLIKKGNFKINKGTNTFFINDLSTLKKGVYILQIANEEMMESYKIMKE